MKKRIMPNIPYLFIFWFANKLGTAYRLADGKDVVNKIAGIAKTLGEAIANIAPSFHPFDLLTGIIGAALIFAFVYFKGKNAKKYRRNVEYGSACWGNEKNIKPYVDPNPDNNIILTATESLTMNSRPSNPKYARNKNVLVIGGSGSGKTRFFCKPNIMQLHSSYVVTDPKGQILIECGKLLKDNQYKIKVLNTIDFKKSMRYNPFQYIYSEKDILKFVTALISNTKGEGKSSDDFWQKAETLLYQALIGYIWYEGPPKEKNMNTLVEMINNMEVREDDETFKNSVDFLFEALEERAPNHFALRQYKKFKLAAGKTSKSILISCGARLSPFDIAEVRELMSEDELELDKIGGYKQFNPKTKKDEIIKEKTALFVIISDTDDSFNFIVALMYSQLFNLMCDRADNEFGGRLPVPTRIILDEFANIGLIPKFEKLIATIRSREISACIVLQAQSQLKAIYKDNMDTIIGNCDTMLFLGGKEKTTLEEISKMLGQETIDLYNTSITRGTQESHGQNFQKLGKALMSIAEIAVMDGGRCILQLRGERPFLSHMFDITRHKNYRYLSDANPENAFNIEKYLSTRLKLRPDDKYEVIEIDLSNEVPESQPAV